MGKCIQKVVSIYWIANYYEIPTVLVPTTISTPRLNNELLLLLLPPRNLQIFFAHCVFAPSNHSSFSATRDSRFNVFFVCLTTQQLGHKDPFGKSCFYLESISYLMQYIMLINYYYVMTVCTSIVCVRNTHVHQHLQSS